MIRILISIVVLFLGFIQYSHAFVTGSSIKSIMITTPLNTMAKAGINKLKSKCSTNKYQDLVVVNHAKLEGNNFSQYYSEVDAKIEPLFYCFKKIYFGTILESNIHLYDNSSRPNYEKHKAVANYIHNEYGYLGAKFGWYITQEFGLEHMGNSTYQNNVKQIYTKLSNDLTAVKNAEIMISPWIKKPYGELNPSARTQIKNGLINTFLSANKIRKIDLQDGLGGTWKYRCIAKDDPNSETGKSCETKNQYIDKVNYKRLTTTDTINYIKNILYPVRNTTNVSTVRVNIEHFTKHPNHPANPIPNNEGCCLNASPKEIIKRERIFTHQNNLITLGAAFSIRYWYNTHYVQTVWPSFDDVPYNHWARNSINNLDRKNVMNGHGSSPRIFLPENSTRRDYMAVYLVRAKHGRYFTPPPATGNVFSDVPKTLPLASWIEQLKRDGITGGCGGGKYCPYTTVSRLHWALFLYRVKYGITSAPTSVGVFSDLIDHPWAGYVERLYNDGIIGGCTTSLPKKFCPNDNLTNAQTAAFIDRAFPNL